MKAAEMLQKSSAFQDVPEDQEVGLVLDAQVAAEGSKACSYYCVSHGDRRIFWLEGMGHEDEVIQCTPSKCKPQLLAFCFSLLASGFQLQRFSAHVRQRPPC